jgi:hypothetical protein
MGALIQATEKSVNAQPFAFYMSHIAHPIFKWVLLRKASAVIILPRPDKSLIE